MFFFSHSLTFASFIFNRKLERHCIKVPKYTDSFIFAIFFIAESFKDIAQLAE